MVKFPARRRNAMRRILSMMVVATCAVQAVARAANAEDVRTPVRTMLIHSHNDYAQKRPFWGAYEAGADSIEADVFLVDGELLVAHSRKGLKKENTLRRLSTNMEVKGDMYTLKDWNKAKNKYVKANQKIMKHRSEYTTAELAEIATLQAKCITGFGKGVSMSTARGVAGVTAGVKSVVDEIKELIEAFGKKKEKEE